MDRREAGNARKLNARREACEWTGGRRGTRERRQEKQENKKRTEKEENDEGVRAGGKSR